MKIYLAALGWVPAAPAGNRLRWHYPADEVDGARYLGLPAAVSVERAWLDEDLPQSGKSGTMVLGGGSLPMAPLSWWDHLGDVHPTGGLPKFFVLPEPAQAVRLLYDGEDTRLVALDGDANIVADQMVSNGQWVNLQAPDISVLAVLAYDAVFRNFMALNLFRDRGLAWEEIARVGVADTVSLSLREAAWRYDGPTTMVDQWWAELVDAANTAQASDPANDAAEPEKPTAWKAFEMMIGIRWEHAVLFGHGYFDGPRRGWPAIDDVRKDLILPGVPPRAAAYRVRDEKERLKASNVAICPPWLAAPLTAPGLPAYESPEVRLTVDTDTWMPKFTATYSLRWAQPDPLALGIEVEEAINSSTTPAFTATPVALSYSLRTRQPDDPPGQGLQVRSQDVVFHDVQFRCRARAVDGWDRTSAFTAHTAWTSLALRHDPAPPNLASATWSTGSASLARQVGDPSYPDWAPDLIVQHDAGARVFVYRRKTGAVGRPATTGVTVSAPVPVEGNRYRATVAGPASLAPYDGGFVVAAPFKAMIRQVVGSDIYFEVGDSTLFGAGAAELQQNPLHLDLWDKVAEFSAHALPATLTFADPVAGPGETADVLSYHTRVAYLGARIGPPGNTVQALRMPVAPVKPPPFSVELLGVDFYNRTLVKIRFTNAVSSGSYTIWWASGTPVDFASKAVPGVMRAQAPYSNRYLFDVLAIPLPQKASRIITVGVQRVTTGEGQSSFETVPVTLPALAP